MPLGNSNFINDICYVSVFITSCGIQFDQHSPSKALRWSCCQSENKKEYKLKRVSDKSIIFKNKIHEHDTYYYYLSLLLFIYCCVYSKNII